MSLLVLASSSHAATIEATRTPFNGTDISGVYQCAGNDIHDGDSHSTMILKLDAKYSSGKFGAYKVTVDDVYVGSIVSNGKQLAMDFANKDLSKHDFGVALATVNTASSGKITIKKFYYEPQYMGGGNGIETCTSK
ncbi:hypothetical protein AB4851_28450 [Burkholderia sp. 22PA0099]|uniref:hypothetical protein n=1 Tax=Burkholderia sp. 22PA0099 TaxID=3237372 RepID=UPI0039C35732